jgi:uncharacterized membrane protein YkvI
MNKIQKITVLTMVVFATVMFAGPIAMNSVDNLAFAHGKVIIIIKHHHHHHHFHHHHFHHHHDRD